MTNHLQQLRFAILSGITALALYVFVPSIALAHAGNDEQGGIDVVTTLQATGVVAVLGSGYFLISRLARRRDGEPIDHA